MTVQKQSFVQPVSSTIPVPTTITNVIATLKGTASPERFYVITGHLDSRVTDVLNFTDDAPGADDDGSGVAVVLELVSRATRRPGSPSRGRTSTTSTRTSGWRTACSSATCRSSWTSATPRGWPR
jgi:hypothetical protein